MRRDRRTILGYESIIMERLHTNGNTKKGKRGLPTYPEPGVVRSVAPQIVEPRLESILLARAATASSTAHRGPSKTSGCAFADRDSLLGHRLWSGQACCGRFSELLRCEQVSISAC